MRSSPLLRRIAPFVAIAVLALATLPLGSRHPDVLLLTAALLLGFVGSVAVVATPWHRLPPWMKAVPPFVALLIVALLREAEGGARSGFAVLVLAPVLWLALYGTRRQLVALLVGIGLLFVLPIVTLGEPNYPDTEWRRALLMVAVSAFVGLSTQQLVATARRRAMDAERMTSAVRDSEAFLRGVMNNAGEGIMALNTAGQVTFANPSAAAMLEYSTDEIVGAEAHGLIHHSYPDGTPYPVTECPIYASMHDGEVHHRSDEVFWRKDGTSFPVEYVGAPIRTDAGITGVVTCFSDISERLEMERMKNEFISIVSHELRTPLTSIRGSLGLMQGGVLGDIPEEAQRMLEIATSNADRLVRLINDILDVERIASGRTTMERRECNLADLLTQTEELLVASAEEVGVRLIFEPVRFDLCVDPDRIIQTLVNLVGNAIKFSPQGSAVTVKADVLERSVRVGVHDEGPGIPPQQRERIFERFAQVDSSATREKAGSGLGLAIARGIIEQHGGRIWVQSEPGGGSTFAFELPFAVLRRGKVVVCERDAEFRSAIPGMLRRLGFEPVLCSGVEEAIAAAMRERPNALLVDPTMTDSEGTSAVALIRQDKEIDNFLPVIVLNSALPAEDTPGVPSQPLSRGVDEEVLGKLLDRVGREEAEALVVEDDPDLAAILLEMFKGNGVTAKHVETAAEARRWLRSAAPSLLVLDLMLPDEDGANIVRWLREEDRCRQTTVVIYTAQDLEDVELSSGLKPVADIMTKSRVSPEEFERRILQLMASSANLPNGDERDRSA